MSTPCSSGQFEMFEDVYLKGLYFCWQRLQHDPAAVTPKTRDLIFHLNALYISLRKEGHKLPIRLPIERNRREAGRKEMAL